MIKSSFELKDFLEAICNDNTLNIGEKALTEEEWKVLRTVYTFLETAAEITTLLSGVCLTVASTTDIQEISETL
jgi:hypothetical protein